MNESRPCKLSRRFIWTVAVIATCLCPTLAFGQNPPPNPVPLINWLTPPSAPPGGSDVTAAVYGAGFVPSSIVRWNGLDRVTTFANANELTAVFSSSDTAVNGTASVTVFNPAAGGGISNTVYFSVTNPTQAVVLGGSSLIVGDFPDCGVAADFNGDGRLDLAIGKLTSDTVSILLGNGDGTFGP